MKYIAGKKEKKWHSFELAHGCIDKHVFTKSIDVSRAGSLCLWRTDNLINLVMKIQRFFSI